MKLGAWHWVSSLLLIGSVSEALHRPVVLQHHRPSSLTGLHRAYPFQRGGSVRLPESPMLPDSGAGSDIRRRTSRNGIVRAMADSAVDGTDEANSLWNVPNVLTLARLVAIPMLILVFYSNHASRAILSFAIFVVASLTDWLDGYLARKWNITSPFGAFLDPVADKLMVATALILLTDSFASPLVTISTAITISREIGISALREWMASMQQRDVVAVGWWGKAKTASQMVAVSGLLLLHPPVPAVTSGPLLRLGLPLSLGFLVLSAVLSITSASGYIRAAWPILSGRVKK